MSLDHEKFIPEAPEQTEDLLDSNLEQSQDAIEGTNAEVETVPEVGAPETEVAPNKPKKLGRTIAAVAGVVAVGVASVAFLLPKGSESSDAENIDTPVATAEPAEVENEVEPTPETPSESETVDSVAAEDEPRTEVEVLPESTDQIDEEPIANTPEQYNETVSIISTKPSTPEGNSVDFELQDGQKISISPIDTTTAESTVLSSLNLIACYATTGNENCLNAFSDNEYVRDEFLAPLHQEVASSMSGQTADTWQVAIFGHDYDPAEFSVVKENNVTTVELTGGTLLMERIVDYTGNEWQGDFVHTFVDKDYAGKDSKFDTFRLTIRETPEGKSLVELVNVSYSAAQ